MDRQLLEIIACPVCKARVTYDPKKKELICRFDQLAYPIQDNIPIMLVSEARRLTEEAP